MSSVYQKVNADVPGYSFPDDPIYQPVTLSGGLQATYDGQPDDQNQHNYLVGLIYERLYPPISNIVDISFGAVITYIDEQITDFIEDAEDKLIEALPFLEVPIQEIKDFTESPKDWIIQKVEDLLPLLRDRLLTWLI